MGTCAREQVSAADALHLGTGDIDLETILLFRCNKQCSSLEGEVGPGKGDPFSGAWAFVV